MRPDLGPNKIFVRLAGGGWALTWLDKGVRIEFRHLRTHDGQAYAECDVTCELRGAKTVTANRSLTCANLNLSSQSERLSRAKYCAERAMTWELDDKGKKTGRDLFDFPSLFDEACIYTIHAMRDSQEIIVLDDAPADIEADHDVLGLKLPADGKGMLVAPQEALKSLMALFIAGTLARRGIATLFCDWEWRPGRHRARKDRMFGSDRLSNLHYLSMRAPLTLELDRVRRFCDAEQIGYVVIDSVGLAADGPLKDDDVALRFHRALSDLPPTLSAANVNKASADSAPGATVRAFGSIYFENLMRQVWTLTKQVGATEDVITIAAMSSKQSSGAKYPPVGLTFTFTTAQITVQCVDLATVKGLETLVPIWQRMKEALRRGPKTLATLAEELDANVDTLDKNVRRKNGLFTRLPGPDGITRIALVSMRES